MKKLIYLFFLFASILILSACGDETINFTISFDTNGGDTIESVEYNGEQTFIVPTQITKEGFTFNGWFLDDDIFEIPFTIDLLIDGTISDDVVVYAKWTINQYQITFINDNQTIISTLLLDYQADLANISYPQHPVKEGYEFISWDKTLPQNMPAEHITLQAVYEIKTFNLIFIDDQGVLISTLTYPFNSDLSNVVIPEAPTKEGHVFSSWNKEIPSTMPATDVTIQALYSINQYNIQFLDFDGSVISNETYDYGTELTLDDYPTEPIRVGYTFTGWSEALPITMPASNLVLEANYTINTYVISFMTEDNLVIDSQSFNYGADLTNLTIPQEPIKEGYEFKGWFHQDELWTGLDVMIDEDIILVATYEMIYYTIDYELNGGSFELVTPPLVYSIDSITFDFIEPIKEGYEFAGWYHNSDFTGELVTSIQIGSTGNLTLYAKWIEVVVPSFDPTELNAIFGFDIYQLMPEIVTSDYLVLDYSDLEYYEVYLDFFDWSEAEAITYINLLDDMLAYDEIEESWMIGNYFIYVYEDTETYEGEVVYGVGIYGERQETNEPTNPFNPNDLNAIFGFDIYQLMPDIISDDTIIYDFSTTTDYAVYIDLFDWIESDANTFVNGLDSLLVYDDIEESWILGDYYIYIYLDTESYPGEEVYSIYIYGSKEGTNEPDAFDPTELNAIFGFDIYQLMPEIVTSDYLVLDYSDLEYYEVYLDFFDWSEAEAITYINLLDDMLAYDEIEESWMIGNYFIYVYEDTETYEGEVVYGVGIYGERQETNEPTNPFNPNDLNAIFGFDIYQLMPDIISDDTIIYDFSTTTDYAVYIDLFDWIESDANTFVNGLDSLLVYDDIEESWILGDYYIYIYLDTESYPGEEVYSIYIYGSKEETGEPIDNLSVLTPRISINEFEKMSFGQSGLPSVGTFNVLVIPVEINGVPFPIDYFAKLDLVFNGSSSATGWESVASYYQKSSYGLLNLTFDISSKYTTTYSRSYYENMGQQGDQYAILETLLAKDPTIDFSQYDSNNDGLIDSVIFIYSTNYDYDTDPWWAWVYAAKYGEASVADDLDGKAFEYYMWASYAFLEDGLPNANQLVVNAETYIHEVGHLMGAVDLYSYTSTYGPMGGMGMMDYNNGDHEPMHKLLFGWLQPLVVYEGSHLIELESYALDQDGINSAIIIPYLSTNFSDGNAFDEFIIIIFYTPEGLYEAHQGYDYVLNESAVIVYHVDARMLSNTGFWQGYFAKDNDGTSDFIMQILEADYNDSIPGDLQQIDISDVLTQGIFNLSNYQWNQGGSMNIEIELSNPILETDDSVSIIVSINPR